MVAIQRVFTFLTVCMVSLPGVTEADSSQRVTKRDYCAEEKNNLQNIADQAFASCRSFTQNASIKLKDCQKEANKCSSENSLSLGDGMFDADDCDDLMIEVRSCPVDLGEPQGETVRELQRDHQRLKSDFTKTMEENAKNRRTLQDRRQELENQLASIPIHYSQRMLAAEQRFNNDMRELERHMDQVNEEFKNQLNKMALDAINNRQELRQSQHTLQLAEQEKNTVCREAALQHFEQVRTVIQARIQEEQRRILSTSFTTLSGRDARNISQARRQVVRAYDEFYSECIAGERAPGSSARSRIQEASANIEIILARKTEIKNFQEEVRRQHLEFVRTQSRRLQERALERKKAYTHELELLKEETERTEANLKSRLQALRREEQEIQATAARKLFDMTQNIQNIENNIVSTNRLSSCHQRLKSAQGGDVLERQRDLRNFRRQIAKLESQCKGGLPNCEEPNQRTNSCAIFITGDDTPAERSSNTQ